jgi:hypothetical protein
MVCKACNSAFSIIEAALMRQSPEAFARIHSQARGRNRRKSSQGPKFQPDSLVTFLPGGGDAEVEIKPGGQVSLLPQFSLFDNQIQGQGSAAAELQAFAARLKALFNDERMLIVTKEINGAGPSFNVLAYEWNGHCYQEAETCVLSKPPKPCIWKDQRRNDSVPGRPYRLYCRSDGQVVLRVGEKCTDSEFLTTFRKNLEQILAV